MMAQLRYNGLISVITLVGGDMAWTHIDLFAGIGGFRLAAMRNGGRCIGYSEISPSAGELRSVRYRFHGRERSAATGLVNFRMRWYDPATGRWLLWSR